MEAYGDHFSELGEGGSELFLHAFMEEVFHAAQYDLYSKLTNSNAKSDHPALANLEFEAKTLTGMAQTQIGGTNFGGSPFQYGENLLSGDALIEEFDTKLEEWTNEQQDKGTLYKNAKSDDSAPQLLQNYLDESGTN